MVDVRARGGAGYSGTMDSRYAGDYSGYHSDTMASRRDDYR